MDTNSKNNKLGSAGRRHPQQVYYQRRRAAAVVVLVVLALLLVWILSSLGGNNEENTAQVAETTTSKPAEVTTSEVTSEAKPAPSSAAKPAEKSAAEKTTSAKPKDSCTIDDLVVSARTDQPNYGEGILPTFYMTIENPTAVDCIIDFTEATPRFEVYNLTSNERMWADIDCNDSVGEGEQTIPPGEERFYQATWSRTTSAPERCEDRQRVEPGSFYLHTVVGNNASQPATFNLR